MLEITSRVRARAREANAKTALEMPTTPKKFFNFFSTFFRFFLIFLKKGQEMSHFLNGSANGKAVNIEHSVLPRWVPCKSLIYLLLQSAERDAVLLLLYRIAASHLFLLGLILFIAASYLCPFSSR